MAWNEDNKIKLTISGTLINEDLTNFPLTITIASGVGTNNIDITEIFDELTTTWSRKRISFFAGGDQTTGNKCFTEIEHWDPINETATLHVQVPTLTSGTDTDLYLYYDITQPDQDYRLNSEADDDFTGTDGDPPEPSRWTKGGNETAQILANKLFLDLTTGSSDYAVLRGVFEGDFDVQADFELDTYPATNSWGQELWFGKEGETSQNVIMVSRNYWNNDHYYIFKKQEGGAWAEIAYVSTSDTIGKLRMVKNGNHFSAYYWDGSWVQIGSTYTFSGWGDRSLHHLNLSYWDSNPVAKAYWDNFTVNSADAITGWVGDTGEVPAQEVWDAGFAAVYHMAQDPSGSTDAILDSTANTNDGTPNGTMTSDDLIDSTLGKAIDFDGSDDYISMGTFNPSSTDLTLEFLCNFDQKASILGHSPYILAKRDSYSETEMMWQVHVYDATDKMAFTTYTDWSGPQDGEFDNYINVSGTWQNFAIVHDDSNLDYLYVDGQFLESHSAISFDSDTTAEVTVGAYTGGGGAFDGKLDEVRISNKVRSSAWLALTNYSLTDSLIYYDLLIPTPSGEALPDAEGWTSIAGTLTSGIVVRLYRRDTGELVGEDISSTASGIWNIPTTYDEYHYAIALYPTSGTNALIKDWLHPTLNP